MRIVILTICFFCYSCGNVKELRQAHDSLKSERDELSTVNSELNRRIRALEDDNKLLSIQVEKLQNQNEGNSKEETDFPEGTHLIDSKVKLIFPGDFSGSSIEIEINKYNWFGVFKSGEESIIKQVEVKTEAIHDQMMDEDGEKSGIRISAKWNGMEPLFLVSGIEGISDNKKEKLYVNESTILYPGKPYKFGDYKEELKAYGSFSKVKRFGFFQNYKVFVSNEKGEQYLSGERSFDDSIYTLEWVGDLDGDGKLDLLMDLSRKYSFNYYGLFLSSKSSESFILAKVADFTAMGC